MTTTDDEDNERDDGHSDWQVPCPECQGLGVIWHVASSGHSWSARCTFCRGKGWVDVD